MARKCLEKEEEVVRYILSCSFISMMRTIQINICDNDDDDDEEEEDDLDDMNNLKVTLARRARDVAEAENKLLQEKNKYVANPLFATNEQCGGP